MTPQTISQASNVAVHAPISSPEHHQYLKSQTPVMTAANVSIEYQGKKTVKAVKNVSLTLNRGEILGLAGESGCGKSTFAYGVSRLLKPPAVMTSGEILFHDGRTDVRVRDLEGDALREFRWDKISLVFQGAMNSLNPVITIRRQLYDVLTTHRPSMSERDKAARASELLQLVGVDPRRLDSFAHELSGGMRQRVMIAMALTLQPPMMIMDEPTTALDVVVQREILTQIMMLREEFQFAVIFITHDLPLLLEISDRIAVMLEGRIVELDTAEKILQAPQHGYTKKLLNSFPSLKGDRGGFVRTGRDEA